MARALIAALELAGHEVTLASRFRSRDSGDPARQERLRDAGRQARARAILRRVERGARAAGPLVHLSPLSQGAGLARAAGRGEARHSLRRRRGVLRAEAGGRAVGSRPSRRAPTRSAAPTSVLQPNPADAECVRPLLDAPDRLVPLAPFLETAPFRAPDRARERARDRRRCSASTADAPWLLAVAMMRDDQKLLSYRVPRRGAVAPDGPPLAARHRRRRAGGGRGARAPSRRFGERVALGRRRRARRCSKRSIAPPTSMSGRRSRRPGAWRCSKRRRPAFRSSPGEAAACRRSSPTARRGCSRRKATPPPSPTPSATLLADPARRAAMGARRDRRRRARPRHRSAAAAARPAPPPARRRRMIPLLVIRHGATDWNAAGLIQGRTDRPLDDAGRAALRAAALPPGWEARALPREPAQARHGDGAASRARAEPRAAPDRDGLGRMGGPAARPSSAPSSAQAMAENEARGLDFRPPAARARATCRRGCSRCSQPRRPDDLRHPQGRAAGALCARDRLEHDRQTAGQASATASAHAFRVAADGTPTVAELNIPLEPAGHEEARALLRPAPARRSGI